MTIKQYISQKLRAFDITEADFCDISVYVDLEAEYTADNAKTAGIALAKALEGVMLAPRRESVNENGFSMSWNFKDISKYYLWLCHKWGIEANSDALSMLGLSMIIDKSQEW